MNRDAGCQTSEIVLHGMSASPGVACGNVFLVKTEEGPVASKNLPADMVEDEMERFYQAIREAREQIQAIRRNLHESIGPQNARILDVHLTFLEDEVFIREIQEEISDKLRNVEYAVWMVSERYAEVLSRIEDAYMRERMADVKDVARRLLRCLGARPGALMETISEGSIIVADNLAPSDTALLRREHAGGLACDLGSPVSHTAIMARALGIPSVVALHDITSRVLPGETILIDGNKGLVVIRPDENRVKAYDLLKDRRRHLKIEITDRAREMSAATTDDAKVALRANIDSPEDMDDVVRYGADGVGLLRSEIMLIKNNRYASEDEQVEAYRTILSRIPDNVLVVRTLDLGGDKFLDPSDAAREDNPFLGCRGIRLCLAHPREFKIQLRAVARIAGEGCVKVMYPMVSDLAELLRANELMRDVCGDMSVPVPPAGVMIETPAAALCADAMAPHVDFMSIGSNDLIQYTMAADRGNDMVSYLFQPAHPAILRLIKLTVDAAGGKPVGICGEMAGDPALTPILIGLGISELSMVAASIPLVKTVLRSLSMTEARDLADNALKSRCADEIQAQCREWLNLRAPDVYELTG